MRQVVDVNIKILLEHGSKIEITLFRTYRFGYTVNLVEKHPLKEVIDSWIPSKPIFIPPLERVVEQRKEVTVTRK